VRAKRSRLRCKASGCGPTARADVNVANIKAAAGQAVGLWRLRQWLV
jgi:hypothetical protein